MIVRELVTKLGFQVDEKGLVTANEKTALLQKRLKGLGQGAVRAGKQLSLFVTLPILGLAAATVKAASDAEETEAKFSRISSF